MNIFRHVFIPCIPTNWVLSSKIICISHFFLYCFAGWRNIVAFTKVLTMYQIYHTWIHPLHHAPLPPSSHFWNSFNRYHFCICIHVYTFFVPPFPSTSVSLTIVAKLSSKERSCTVLHHHPWYWSPRLVYTEISYLLMLANLKKIDSLSPLLSFT
jgi:hypothetical protein